MKKKKVDEDDGRPLARVEEITDELLRRGATGSIIVMGSAMRQLREALDAAAKQNAWDLVELSFAKATALGVELLVRSQVEMRDHLRRHDETGGAARRYPDIAASAERFQRIIDFVLDIAGTYSRVRHVVDLERRKTDDPKLVDFAKARAAMPRKRAGAGKKKKAGGRA